MARYIDAELLKKMFKDAYGIDISFDRVPAADVAPVVHAHWIEYTDYGGDVYPQCSRCGLIWWLEDGTAMDNEMYYCPKCGAKMDEEVER